MYVFQAAAVGKCLLTHRRIVPAPLIVQICNADKRIHVVINVRQGADVINIPAQDVRPPQPVLMDGLSKVLVCVLVNQCIDIIAKELVDMQDVILMQGHGPVEALAQTQCAR